MLKLKTKFLVAAVLGALVSSPLLAKDTNSDKPQYTQTVSEMSFMKARELLHAKSFGLRMKEADITHAKEKAHAAKFLSGPKVSLSAMQIEGTKSVDMDISGITSNIKLPPNLLPPGLIPSSISFKEDIGGPRASLNLIWPLYTGGAISAYQDALNAKTIEAQHAKNAYINAVDVDLVLQYWGYELNRNILSLREANLKNSEESLREAISFEKKGVISKIERMAIEVNRDAAKRDYEAAKTDFSVAASSLKRTLQEERIEKLSTPLFVLTRDIGSLNSWIDKGLAKSPLLAQVESVKDEAQAGVKAAQSAYHPQVFLFGQKNLIKHYLTLPEPDWIAGIGVNITLWDNKDRASSVSAARALEDKAINAKEETRNSLLKAIEIAHLKTTQAKEEWELTSSSLALAKENLKLREKSFKEGLSTALDVNTARTQLLAAQIAEQVAAYKFVAGWANLTAASGSFDEFTESLASPSCLYIETPNN